MLEKGEKAFLGVNGQRMCNESLSAGAYPGFVIGERGPNIVTMTSCDVINGQIILNLWLYCGSRPPCDLHPQHWFIEIFFITVDAVVMF